METYNLPYHQKAKLSKVHSFFLYFTSIFCAISAGAFFIGLTKDKLVVGLLLGFVMLAIGGLFEYVIIFIRIIKKGYIEITTDYIKVSTPYKIKTTYWRDIYEVSIYSLNNQIVMGILLKKDLEKKRKRTVLNMLNSMDGAPLVSFQVSLIFFKDIDIEKLLLTIEEQINQMPVEDDISVEEMLNKGINGENNIFKAIVSSFLFCIFISTIYGYTIYKLEENYLVIPIIASLFIIAIFNKFYIEEYFNLGVRLLIGIICLIQIPVALVEHIILLLGLKFTIRNILDVTGEYFYYIIDNPLEHIFLLLGMAICFGIGVTRGRVGR